MSDKTTQDKLAELAVKLTEQGHADKALELLSTQEKTSYMGHPPYISTVLGCLVQALASSRGTLSQRDAQNETFAMCRQVGLDDRYLDQASYKEALDWGVKAGIIDEGGRFLALLDKSMIGLRPGLAELRNDVLSSAASSLEGAYRNKSRALEQEARALQDKIQEVNTLFFQKLRV